VNSHHAGTATPFHFEEDWQPEKLLILTGDLGIWKLVLETRADLYDRPFLLVDKEQQPSRR